MFHFTVALSLLDAEYEVPARRGALKQLDDRMSECREHPRIPMDMLVFFSDTNKTDIFEGTMSDLSVTGCTVISLSTVHQRRLHRWQQVITIHQIRRS